LGEDRRAEQEPGRSARQNPLGPPKPHDIVSVIGDEAKRATRRNLSKPRFYHILRTGASKPRVREAPKQIRTRGAADVPLDASAAQSSRAIAVAQP
jgi:hypothetical protein